jgi:ribose/xylose/arabinose/galactoside ABC-type transport system permease subunit
MTGLASLRSRVAGRVPGESRNRQWLGLVPAVAFVVLAVIAAVTSDTFLSESNLSNLLRQIVTNGLISLGMLVVILSGGIDLSVGAIVALVGIVAAGLSGVLPWPAAIAVALVVAGIAGLINGTLVAVFRLPPFIATLATLSAFRGLVYVISETPIVPADDGFRQIVTSTVGPVPTMALLMLACFGVVGLFLSRTTAGRAIYSIGGNEEAVRLAGINVRAHVVAAYVICAFFAGLAGVILTSRVGIAQPSVGVAFELDAIAACVIGGAVLGGGGGSVRGTLAGVLLLGLINNLLNLFGVQSYFQQIFKGALIVLAVLARRRGA